MVPVTASPSSLKVTQGGTFDVTAIVTVSERHADIRASHGNRFGDFVPAANARGDHRPPAPWRGVGDDVPAVPDRPEHGLSGIENAVSELVNKDRLARGPDRYQWSGFAKSCAMHANGPRVAGLN